ncbi:LOW QUALITY PROTEIN: Fanconi anemia group I protein [Diaphorina citri]|uniref:LOW QUALITY PROTEIN: Fanconi anemia group I protein n=1 Tax=Diaphorina citri TaxID=121845 RepID=A0A3Q0INT5_DIACI|nr:LOW QUALITY PROTEIN: Fanconi anemia group I protein [Diaphorina citri]
MYETEILRIIKTIITNCFIEMEYRHNSGWIRKQEATACDVEHVFKTLIESNVAGKEKVLKGLVNISFALLCTNASPKLSQAVVNKIRRSGRYMIILLIKKHRQVYLEVMNRLCHSLYSGEFPKIFQKLSEGPSFVRNQINSSTMETDSCVTIQSDSSTIQPVFSFSKIKVYLMTAFMKFYAFSSAAIFTCFLIYWAYGGVLAFCLFSLTLSGNGELNYQYTDTLHQICSMCIYSAQEHITPLLELIKSMFRLPHQIIRKIIVAVLPIAKLKSDFRNALILTLRKMLFSKDVYVKQTAVFGFLHILKQRRWPVKHEGVDSIPVEMLFSKDVYVKQTAVFGFLHILKQMQLKQIISSYSQNSLNQMKGPSLFTQMIMDVHSSQSQTQNAVLATQMSANKNEAVCLEVLGVLRRCLTQPALVRSSLYRGFIECVHMNSDLCLGSMELLLEHCRVFYVVDTDTLPPLHMDKIVALNEKGEYILQEPIAELLLVLGQVVNTAKHNASPDHDSTLSSTIEVIGNKMDSLVDRFIKCGVDTFSLSEESVEAAYRKEVTVQVLGVYEALMTYKLFSLSVDTPLETSNALLNLYRQYSVFVEFVNALPKAKQGGKKPEGPSQATKKEEKASLNIKLPVTVLDLKILQRYLELIFMEELDWASTEAAKKIRAKRELRHYVLSTVLHVVQVLDSQSGDRKGSSVYKDVCALSQIIYKYVLLKWEEVNEFDCKMSALCLNIFHAMISIIINHYDADFPDFLYKVTGRDVSLGIKKQVLSLLKVYNALISSHLDKLQAAPEEDEEYTEVCNTLEVSINTLAKITLKLENECIHLIRKWVVEICETNEIEHKGICKQVVNLMLTLTLRDSDDVTILDTMTLQLGKVPGSSKLAHKLEIMNKSTRPIILPILCEYISKCMNSVEWLLVRLRSHYNILHLYRSEEAAAELSEKEKSLVQFSQLICSVVKNLAHLKLPNDTIQLGKVPGSSKLAHKLEIMNKSTRPIILPILCEYISKCMNSVEWLLIRLRSHYNILHLYRSEEAAAELSEKEKSLVQFSQLICSVVKNLAHLKLPNDTTQCCLRVLVRCYTLLNNIAKYYQKNSLTCYKAAKFDCLVSFVSVKLSTQVADFIHDIEDDSNGSSKNAKFVNQLVPRIILEQENFAKLILMLSKKNKDSALKVRLIETRDFKLNVRKIQENVAENEAHEEEDGPVEPTQEVEEPARKRSRLDTSASDTVSNDVSSTY